MAALFFGAAAKDTILNAGIKYGIVPGYGEHAKSHRGSACGVAGQGAAGERKRYYTDDSNRAATRGGFAGVRTPAPISWEGPV